MKTEIVGNGSPVVGIVACLHGNEVLGSKVVDSLKNLSLENGRLVLVVANEEAMKQNKRFVDVDLNRCFPGKLDGNSEERLAVELLKELKDCDYVIDIHSTTAETEGFVIITDVKLLEFAKSFGLKIILMNDSIVIGKSLIENVNGVSLEFNCEEEVEFVLDKINNCLDVKSKVFDVEVFEVYGMLEEGSNLKNFEKVNIDGEEFYPVLFGEKEYKFSCFKASKLS